MKPFLPELIFSLFVLFAKYGFAQSQQVNFKSVLLSDAVTWRKIKSITQDPQGYIWLSKQDNRNGIPQKMLDKILQPFFTTKPSGQGTGLGLSLSYDIVKAHGGELKVETKEGEGSEFIIHLVAQTIHYIK